MSVEFQNEVNQTRHLLHMKKMMQLVKDKKSFDNYMKKLERMQKFRALTRMR